MLVVLDTNILLSGIIWGGNPEKIIATFYQGKTTIAFSKETFQEFCEKVLIFSQKYPPVKEKLYFYQKLLARQTEFFVIKKHFSLSRDSKDNKFLDLAYAAKAEYLITGDKDLLILKKFKKTKIVSPKQFLKEISNENQS